LFIFFFVYYFCLLFLFIIFYFLNSLPLGNDEDSDRFVPKGTVSVFKLEVTNWSKKESGEAPHKITNSATNHSHDNWQRWCILHNLTTMKHLSVAFGESVYNGAAP
jgi:hypothetical protein